MAKDAITMFKEAAAQLQREEAYLALDAHPLQCHRRQSAEV